MVIDSRCGPSLSSSSPTPLGYAGQGHGDPHPRAVRWNWRETRANTAGSAYRRRLIQGGPMSTSTQLVAGHRAEVVIVGGGIMGASIAYHLARAGITDVIVLESGEIACGSSGKPLGGVPRPVLRPREHRAGPAQPARVRSLRRGDRQGHRAATGRLPVRPSRPGRCRTVRGEHRAADRARGRQPVVDADAAVAPRPYLDASRLVAAAWSPGDGVRPAPATPSALPRFRVGAGVTSGGSWVCRDRPGRRICKPSSAPPTATAT